MARDHTVHAVRVHRRLEHVIVVLLPFTPTDRCQKVGACLVIGRVINPCTPQDAADGR